MRSPSPISRRVRVGCAAFALAGLLVVLGGCTSPRNTLGTNSSPCFRALSVARTAVGGVGRFSGVRYLTVSAFLGGIARVAHDAAQVPAAVREDKNPVCVVGYVGYYAAAKVEKGWPVGRTGGRFAVVAVDAKTNRLLGTLLLRRSPVRFSKTLV